MRAFIALPMPEDVADLLEGLQADCPVGQAVAPGNLHLTLAFLGDQPEEHLEAAHDALVTVRAPIFDLELDGLGTFGKRRPVSLHFAARAGAALGVLHDKIKSRLHGAGLMLPHRRFVPHVTLMRFSHRTRPGDRERLAGFLASHGQRRLAPFPVTGFSLYHSTLSPDGAEYDVLAEYSLTNPAAAS